MGALFTSSFSPRIVLWIGLLFAVMAPAWADGIDAQFSSVHQYFPAASKFGPITGDPRAADVYQGDKVIGYVFESKMVAPVPAYSGEPINILIAITSDGRIVGTKVLEQHEPILLVGIPVQKLYDFVAHYIGHNVSDDIVVGNGAGDIHIDAISSATVTSMAVNQTIMDAAMKVAQSRSGASGGPAKPATDTPAIRMDAFEPADWDALTGNGAIRSLHLTRGQVSAAFRNMPAPLFDDETVAPDGASNQTFIDLYYTLLSPPSVGRNLLGADAYKALMGRLKPGDQPIAVMANGLYSFKGLGYVRGGIFDRVHLVQGRKVILFHDSDSLGLSDIALKTMPSFREMAIFVVRKAYGFDAGRPWMLQLLVRRQIGPLKSVYTTFEDRYELPGAYLVGGAAQARPDRNAPLWVKIWLQNRFRIAVLVVSLLLLTTVLVFQDWFAQRPRILEPLRTGFLVYTVVFIGWYGLAQLSVVNILTFIHALLHDFRWSTFLMDPMIFILWGFVAVTLLLLGRGVYCGWLCPFGALQALINMAAKKLRIPQIEFPTFVHERLWAVKYIILLGLFGLSLQSVNLAEQFAEVEPFKTAIDLHFVRSWAFVLYAVGLLAVSAFNNKFYCRYVCPLGAGLAVAGRWRLFEWLRRRRECGQPCHVCANECEVKAIDVMGRINHNECHYCLDCQVTYWNDHKCPPLVQARKGRERLREKTADKEAGKRPATVFTQSISRKAEESP